MTQYLSGAMRESVTVTERDWGFYSRIAKEHDTTVAAVLEMVLRKYAALEPQQRRRALVQHRAPRKSLEQFRARITEMLDAGLTDTAIARELDLNQPSVSRYRRSALNRDPNGTRGGAR